MTGQFLPSRSKAFATNGARASGTCDTGTYLRVDDSSLKFGWFEDSGSVEVRWTQDGDEVKVELTQESPSGSLDDRISCQFDCYGGWTMFLINLKAWLEHGVDIRETNPDRRGAINV